MNRFAKILALLNTLTAFISEDLKQELSELIAFIENNGNNGKIIIKRNLDKLKFVKTIIVPAFSTTKTKFFVQGNNDHGLKIWMSERFEKEILPHIPANLNFEGGKVESFELTKNMGDGYIQNELGSPSVISIEDWAKRTAAMIINNSSDLKKNGYSNIQYVKASDGRTVVVYAWLNDGQWRFTCYELGEISNWHAGLVLDSAMVEIENA